MMRAVFPCLLLLFALAGREVSADDFEFFEKKIRPIFVEHCYKCHSADAEKLKGDLFLDTKAGILKGGESGAALVPGDIEKSLLIKAVRYTDKDLQMPPEKAGGKLSATQIADLETWVKSGALDPRTNIVQSSTSKVPSAKSPYDFAVAKTNWAYSPPKNPLVPKVKNKKWAKSPIDNFILAKLEEKQLAPAPPADKRALIRRATFDLTGLPPTPKEIENFLADKSSGAFAKVVERLLASPQYGVRWGRHWLDLVRYADSLGSNFTLVQDIIHAWRYRDWVAGAFNRDLPYDQFITQQIAGDLLPPPEPDGMDTNAIIATGLYAIGHWGNGDSDKEKIQTDIVDDAVDVTGRAFLGLTLACARCHDHKFDPIPTADYYSLAGIFFSSHIMPKRADSSSTDKILDIPLISKAETERRQKRETRMAELEKQIETITDDAMAALIKQSIPLTARYLMAAGESLNDRSSRREKAHSGKLNQSLLTSAATNELEELNETVLRRWIEFLDKGYLGLLPNPHTNVAGYTNLLGWKNSRSEDNPVVIYNINAGEFTVHPGPTTGVAIGWKSPVSGAVKISGHVKDAAVGGGDGIDWLVTQSGKQLAGGTMANASMQSFGAEITLQTVEVARGEMIQLTILPKADYLYDMTYVDLEITELGGQKRVWNVNKEVATDFLKQNPRADSFGNAAVWNFIDLAAVPKSFSETNSLLAKFISNLSRKNSDSQKFAAEIQRGLGTNGSAGLQEDLVSARGVFWSSLRADETIFPAATREKLAGLKSELTNLKNNPPPPIALAHGMLEGGTPETSYAGVHDAKIHVRGRYDRLGETVPRRFPQILAGDKQTPVTEGSGRLQLAKWLTSPENPLTARVMVNRIWQHHFGEGIVRTPNNYGKLGEPPTHPELLDFLAHRFMECGWSIKAMHRAMMLSATYQQSSTVIGAQASRLRVSKPSTSTSTNLLKLEASKLAGETPALLLDPENKLFGRMNRHRLESEALRDSLLSVAGKLDLTLGGPPLRDFSTNRRTIYLATVRSDRATYQFLFDAADPTAVVDKRLDSTVAPQALFLMNHPFVAAQTKSLTERIGKLPRASERGKIQWLYENLYGRPPTPPEIKIGAEVLAQARAEAKDKADSEQKAWEKYCQLLLCANEFIYVD